MRRVLVGMVVGSDRRCATPHPLSGADTDTRDCIAWDCPAATRIALGTSCTRVALAVDDCFFPPACRAQGDERAADGGQGGKRAYCSMRGGAWVVRVFFRSFLSDCVLE